jgi:glycopeptide antibiotics resistance protein
VRLALLFIPVCVFCFCLFLSSLVWFFLWLPEEELTLLFLLHRENGDFSILMKDMLLCIICSKFDVSVSDIVQKYCSGVF